MGPESTVTSPDGRRWRVRRHWLDRPLPDLRRRFKANREEVHTGDALDGLWGLDVSDAFAGDSPAAAIVAVVALVLIVFVVLPLLGVAMELIAVLIVLFAGLFGRLLLGRPWLIDAVNLDDPEDRVAFAVRGWRQSSEALSELRATIAASGPPNRIAAGETLATRSRAS